VKIASGAANPKMGEGIQAQPCAGEDSCIAFADWAFILKLLQLAPPPSMRGIHFIISLSINALDFSDQRPDNVFRIIPL
jgi:hypothetical protein